MILQDTFTLSNGVEIPKLKIDKEKVKWCLNKADP